MLEAAYEIGVRKENSALVQRRVRTLTDYAAPPMRMKVDSEGVRIPPDMWQLEDLLIDNLIEKHDDEIPEDNFADLTRLFADWWFDIASPEQLRDLAVFYRELAAMGSAR